MGKFSDPSTYATNPGGLRLSSDKLRRLEPALYLDQTFVCNALCPTQHPASEMRERFEEQLQSGNAEPAVVLSVDPLLVGAYACDLDGVILLKFPNWLVAEHRLSLGSRLLTVNVFYNPRMKEGGDLAYPRDIVPGPKRLEVWSSFTPLIAEFVSDDAEAIAALKAAIPEEEWTPTRKRAARCAAGSSASTRRATASRPRAASRCGSASRPSSDRCARPPPRPGPCPRPLPGPRSRRRTSCARWCSWPPR
jgi:hypothetical protein